VVGSSDLRLVGVLTAVMGCLVNVSECSQFSDSPGFHDERRS
jgi:hypothetical protein